MSRLDYVMYYHSSCGCSWWW